GTAIGGYVAQALPRRGGLDAQKMFASPRKAYVLLHAEPELDCANPAQARAALDAADFVVALTPYKSQLDYADVLLPVGPFTETSGTFINMEGRVQGFNGVAHPFGETRPAWKVLRVLGSMLGLAGFDYTSSEGVRDEYVGGETDLSSRLVNRSTAAVPDVAPPAQANGALERVADVPLY